MFTVSPRANKSHLRLKGEFYAALQLAMIPDHGSIIVPIRNRSLSLSLYPLCQVVLFFRLVMREKNTASCIPKGRPGIGCLLMSQWHHSPIADNMSMAYVESEWRKAWRSEYLEIQKKSFPQQDMAANQHSNLPTSRRNFSLPLWIRIESALDQ